MYGSLIATVFPDVRDRRLDLLINTKREWVTAISVSVMARFSR